MPYILSNLLLNIRYIFKSLRISVCVYEAMEEKENLSVGLLVFVYFYCCFLYFEFPFLWEFQTYFKTQVKNLPQGFPWWHSG